MRRQRLGGPPIRDHFRSANMPTSLSWTAISSPAMSMRSARPTSCSHSSPAARYIATQASDADRSAYAGWHESIAPASLGLRPLRRLGKILGDAISPIGIGSMRTQFADVVEPQHVIHQAIECTGPTPAVIDTIVE